MNFNFGTPQYLSRDSLKAVLKDFDPLPDAHRLTVWKTILQLPNNKSEYITLRELSKKSKFTEIGNGLDNRDEISKKTIERVVRSILEHCPTLGQFESFDLLGFVDSFSPLLASNELIYFEVLFTILVNFCQHWFDHLPSPPHSLLSLLDIISLKMEPELYRHLAVRGVRSVNYAWKWMSTAFQMIIDPREFFNLWDHILINHPSFAFFLPLAACKLQKKFLLALRTHEEIMNLLCSSTPLDIKSLLETAYQLYQLTPQELHPKKMTHNFHPLIHGAYPMLNPTDLITFGSETTGLCDLNLLLARQEETVAEVDAVIEEGLTFRRNLIE